MCKNYFLNVIGVVCVATLLSCEIQEPKQTPPNIVFIMADDIKCLQ